jgi:hypothetical protein
MIFSCVRTDDTNYRRLPTPGKNPTDPFPQSKPQKQNKTKNGLIDSAHDLLNGSRYFLVIMSVPTRLTTPAHHRQDQSANWNETRKLSEKWVLIPRPRTLLEAKKGNNYLI